jgi:hypothetical protein
MRILVPRLINVSPDPAGAGSRATGGDEGYADLSVICPLYLQLLPNDAARRTDAMCQRQILAFNER